MLLLVRANKGYQVVFIHKLFYCVFVCQHKSYQAMVSECKLCEVLARNVALEKEVKEVKVLLAQTRQQILEVRQEASVRSRASGQR